MRGCPAPRTSGTLITMRGDYGEFNSWQYPMGQGTPKVLEAMGMLLYSVEEAEEPKGQLALIVRRFPG